MAFVLYDDAVKNEMMDSLLLHIESGKSMREVCRMDGMPDHTTVIRWMRDDGALATKYARARMAQADVLFDRMETVEEQVSAGTMDSHAARVVLDVTDAVPRIAYAENANQTEGPGRAEG